MNNYAITTLGDVCQTISESYRTKSDEVILINTSDVFEGNILNHEKVKNEKLPGQFKKTFQKNDILYSEIRPANKHFAFVDISDTTLYIASTKLMVIRAKSEIILPELLYIFLTAPQQLIEFQQAAETRSGTFPQITFQSEIAPTQILLPDIQTQRRIVQCIKSLTEKMKLLSRINRNLEQQAQAIFKSWFVDFEPFQDGKYVDSELGLIPEEWRVGTMGEIIELHDSKRVPLSGSQREKMRKIYPYYGAASLMDYVDEYIFDGKYLLLGEDGTVVDDSGYPILQYVWGQFWVNNHAHILTGRQGFTVESLLLLFKHTPVKSIVTGAVQPKISQANLKSIPVVIPPLQEMNTFNLTIQPLFDQIRQNEDQNKILASLRDSLLPKLMSGEIDVSSVTI